jgi:hypothetical protein
MALDGTALKVIAASASWMAWLLGLAFSACRGRRAR